jgi:hypothetical protein
MERARAEKTISYLPRDKKSRNSIYLADIIPSVEMRNMELEVDIKEMKGLLKALNDKIDILIKSRETLSMMLLSERSLKEFLDEEPDIYSIKDLKVRYT